MKKYIISGCIIVVVLLFSLTINMKPKQKYKINYIIKNVVKTNYITKDVEDKRAIRMFLLNQNGKLYDNIELSTNNTVYIHIKNSRNTIITYWGCDISEFEEDFIAIVEHKLRKEKE